MFLVLYPAGIAGEVGTLLAALPQAWGRRWALGAGNPHNVAYSGGVVILLLLSLYPVGGPLMVGHMWRERGKWAAKRGKA